MQLNSSNRSFPQTKHTLFQFLPHSSTIIRPILTRGIHVGSYDFDIEDGFAVTLDVVQAKPMTYLRIGEHPLIFDIAKVTIGLEESSFLGLWPHVIYVSKPIIT